MLNFEWLRSYDPLRVIARNEAIQTISILNYMKTSKRLTAKAVGLFAFNGFSVSGHYERPPSPSLYHS